MRRVRLSIPEIAFIGGTRAAAGAGLALLLADRLTSEHRRAVGFTLLGVGLLATIPIIIQLTHSGEAMGPEHGPIRRRPRHREFAA